MTAGDADDEAGATPLEAGGPNAIAVTLGLLGDEWNLWILRHAVAGCRRYGDWIARGPISNAVLTTRLATLTDAGLVERVLYSQRPARYEYRLTARGRGLWPVLLGMWAWEKAHGGPVGAVSGPGSGDRAPLPERRHTRCGQRFSPVATCAACDEPFARRDVAAELGPSGAWSRSVPASVGRRRSSSARRPSPYLDRTMDLLGDRWSAALVGALMFGRSRFGELAARTGAPPTVLSDRLRRFEDVGVVVATTQPDRPDRPLYLLTSDAAAFFPVIAAMITWGQRWFRAPEGPAITFTHVSCGATLAPRLRCDRCGEALHAHEILVEDNAGDGNGTGAR